MAENPGSISAAVRGLEEPKCRTGIFMHHSRLVAVYSGVEQLPSVLFLQDLKFVDQSFVRCGIFSFCSPREDSCCFLYIHALSICLQNSVRHICTKSYRAKLIILVF